MKFLSTPPIKATIEVSIAELQALKEFIGPTSEGGRIVSGISESSSKLLSQIYDDIDDFLLGELSIN